MKQPLVLLTVVFCLGILTCSKMNITFVPIYLLSFMFLALSLISFKKGLFSNFFLLSLVFLLGALYLKNYQILPNCHIARFIPYKSDPISLIGVIDNDPVYQDRNISFILRAEKLKLNETWEKTCGKVLVRVFRKEEFCYGDRLFLRGNLYKPFFFSKGFNYRDYLKHQGIYFILNIKRDDIVKHLNKDVGSPIKSFAFRTKHKMREVIIENLSPFSAGILSAVILGERQNLSTHTRDILVKSGTVHIIAISGLHLAIVAFAALLILKILRIPRRPRYLLCILLLFIYCILTGARLPVVRATLMASILLFSYFLQRQNSVYNSCCLAAILILLINPRQLFDIGFELSFASVVSIIFLYPKLRYLLGAQSIKIKYLKVIFEGFLISLSAWLGTMGFIAYHFKIFSPITVVANVLIVPLASLITLCGFSLIVVGFFFPAFVTSFASTSELAVALLFKINGILIKFPGAYFYLPNF